MNRNQQNLVDGRVYEVGGRVAVYDGEWVGQDGIVYGRFMSPIKSEGLEGMALFSTPISNLVISGTQFSLIRGTGAILIWNCGGSELYAKLKAKFDEGVIA